LKWEEIGTLAELHGVRPRLLQVLQQQDFGADAAPLRSNLEAFHRAYAPGRLHYAAELIKVAELLKERRIEFALFKGAPLAIQLYGHVAGREFSDLDLIVRQCDMNSAADALQSCGYAPYVADKAYREAFLAYQQQFMFVNPKSLLIIDVHWKFITKGVPFPIEPEEIWHNLANFDLAGRKLPTLGSNELAVFMAGHGTKEGWSSLKWVLDFALLADRATDIDWIGVHERSKRHRCGRTVLLGVLLASNLFNARFNVSLLEMARADERAQQIAASVIARLQSRSVREYNEALLANFDLCEHWWQRTLVAMGILTTRTTGDYKALPLPRQLWQVYHFLRPFRLALLACGLGTSRR